MRRIATSSIVLMMMLLVGCQSVGRSVPGIGNFAQVEEDFFRGAQPSERGIATLKERGVRTVINLRDDPHPRERAWVESAGMRYVHVPSNAARVDARIIRQFLEEVQASPRPVFVHCKMGRDRTGLEIAVYRMVHQNWRREEALRELYRHGYNWPLYPGIARYLRTYDPTLYATPTETAEAGG